MRMSILRAGVLGSLLAAVTLLGAEAEGVGQEPATAPGEKALEARQKRLQQCATGRSMRAQNDCTESVELDLGGVDAGVTERYVFDCKGRLISWTRRGPAENDDVTETYGYDERDRLTLWFHEEEGEGEDHHEWYRHDDANRLVYREWALPDAFAPTFTNVETFGYDEAGRLASYGFDGLGYWRDYDESFVYDAAGRLTFYKWMQHGYGWSERYTYDASGALVSTHWQEEYR